MFETYSVEGQTFFIGPSEDTALFVAIKRTQLRGVQHLVSTTGLADTPDGIRWDVEPDTKVDDDDPTFPVIVHWRGGES